MKRRRANDPSRALDLARQAARAAGGILIERGTQARAIKIKGERDIVTDADFAANRAIREMIERAFPTHTILSEEDAPPTRKSEFLWIIDPLDGTTNYSRGYPVYSTSIALARRGRVQLGVVYDPVRDECFSASRGNGAFLNDIPIEASGVATLDEALLGFELTRDQFVRERGLNWFAQLAARTVTARIGGSAALSLCYIAAGRLDAYLHLSLSAWDVAAGMLLAREAGARVTHLDGRYATVRGGSYLASNRKLFPALLRAVNELAATSIARHSKIQTKILPKDSTL